MKTINQGTKIYEDNNRLSTVLAFIILSSISIIPLFGLLLLREINIIIFISLSIIAIVVCYIFSFLIYFEEYLQYSTNVFREKPVIYDNGIIFSKSYLMRKIFHRGEFIPFDNIEKIFPEYFYNKSDDKFMIVGIKIRTIDGKEYGFLGKNNLIKSYDPKFEDIIIIDTKEIDILKQILGDKWNNIFDETCEINKWNNKLWNILNMKNVKIKFLKKIITFLILIFGILFTISFGTIVYCFFILNNNVIILLNLILLIISVVSIFILSSIEKIYNNKLSEIEVYNRLKDMTEL